MFSMQGLQSLRVPFVKCLWKVGDYPAPRTPKAALSGREDLWELVLSG